MATSAKPTLGYWKIRGLAQPIRPKTPKPQVIHKI